MRIDSQLSCDLRSLTFDVCLLIVCFAGLYSPTAKSDEVELDRTKLEQVENLVLNQSLPGDPIWAKLGKLQENPNRAYVKQVYSNLQLEYQRRLYHRVSTSPGLKPYLFHLLKSPRERNPPYVDRLLNALASRVDLQSEDVAAVRAAMVEILEHPVLKQPSIESALQSAYLAAGTRVVGREITEENEAVLLRCLLWRHRGDVNSAAAKVLRENANIQSIPAIEGAMWRLALTTDAIHSEMIRKELDLLKRQAANPRKSKAPRPTGMQPPKMPVFVREEAYPDQME